MITVEDRNRADALRGHRSRGLRDADVVAVQTGAALTGGARRVTHDGGARGAPAAGAAQGQHRLPRRTWSASARSATARPASRCAPRGGSSPSESPLRLPELRVEPDRQHRAAWPVFFADERPYGCGCAPPAERRRPSWRGGSARSRGALHNGPAGGGGARPTCAEQIGIVSCLIRSRGRVDAVRGHGGLSMRRSLTRRALPRGDKGTPRSSRSLATQQR